MSVFKENYVVNMSDIGNSNLITNIGFLRILEDVACKHSDMVGFGVNNIEHTNLSWVLLAWKLKIIRRVKYGEKITACTWARDTKKFTTYRDFTIVDKDGNIVCIASTKWTLINASNGSIAPITTNIISKYEPEETHVFDDTKIDKLVSPASFISEYIYKTQRRDIDVNHHMHNINYLSLAYEALPDDIYNSVECNNVEIMYKSGIKLGDTVKCLYSNLENAHYITIKNFDDERLNAIIKLY